MDELVEYLYNTNPKNIIIGEDDCNLLILGDGSDIPTKVKMLLLVVGCMEAITSNTICELRDKYKNNTVFYHLFDAGKKMAGIAGIPFVMVGYKKCEIDKIDDTYIESMEFIVIKICPEEKDGLPAIYSSNDFVKYLYSLMGMDCNDEGTNKEKNKSLADVFHIWSRSKLSSQLVKQDFDAIYNNEDKFAMIEVKRSPTKTVKSWSPYRADGRNYDIQNQFAKNINAAFFTFHHNGGNCNDSTKIGCYKVLDVDIKSNKKWIDYQKTIISAKEIIGILKP